MILLASPSLTHVRTEILGACSAWARAPRSWGYRRGPRAAADQSDEQRAADARKRAIERALARLVAEGRVETRVILSERNQACRQARRRLGAS